MAEQIQLDVVTPDKLLVSEMVDIVIATSTEGEFGVLHGHIPLLTTLQTGELRYRQGGELHYIAVAGGFAEVSNNKVTILAESAESGREINLERAQQARDRAERRLAEAQKAEAMDYVRAEAALRRAMLRIKISEKMSMH